MSAQSQVPDEVLRWLYSSLAGNYHDATRTYSDAARTLETYPSLSPRTDIYSETPSLELSSRNVSETETAFENGSSALLLVLNGTIPVAFRGATYRYPVAIWVPHAYPHEAPIVFLRPTADMVVRPGQHVSVEGRVYHPYLANWPSHWNVSSMADLVAILRDLFAKEPPVMAKQQPDVRLPLQQSQRPTHSPGPPLPPPKPGSAGPSTQTQSHTPIRGAPPLPPLPPKPGQPLGTNHPRPATVSPAPGSPSIQRDYSQGPPPPPLPHQQQGPGQPTSRLPHPVADPRHALPTPSRAAPHIPAQQPPQHPNSPYYHPQQDPYGQRSSATTLPQGMSPRPGPMQNPPIGLLAAAPSTPSVKPGAPDLMTDPLDVTLPSQQGSAAPVPAPPIPPNPEKDALLNALSETLRAQIHQTISQNAAAIPALEAQGVALQQAQQRMEHELYQLEELDRMLVSNEQTLQDSTREADRVMDGAGQREVPSVDEVLVAPTIVGEQLYHLVAEERSISDAMFLLTRALDKGRVPGDVFIKQTRSLAREQFMKKALIKKIGQGMGLSLPEGM